MKQSGLGKVVMFLYKLPEETTNNRRMAKVASPAMVPRSVLSGSGLAQSCSRRNWWSGGAAQYLRLRTSTSRLAAKSVSGGASTTFASGKVFAQGNTQKNTRSAVGSWLVACLTDRAYRV